MQDEYVNKGRVHASIAWAAVVALMTVGWAIAIFWPEHWRYAAMFAATSCALSAFAAVLHIKCYAVRVANLVRAVRHADPAGLEHNGHNGPRAVL